MNTSAIRSFVRWALPGIVFVASFEFAACSESAPPGGDCKGGAGGSHATSSSTTSGGTPTSSSSSSSSTSSGSMDPKPGSGTNTTSQDQDNTFDHFNDPGSSGSKDPFEILKERAEEGPPEIRTRLHSCTKVAYAPLGAFLASRGVNLAATSTSGPKTAGELYKNGGDAIGVAKFDAREGESYFHTTASATKMFDIFVQAAPEIIANIQNVDACKYNGQGKPMFDAQSGKCTFEALSCIMGRPATADDLTICNLLVEQADPNNPADLTIKRNIAVAVFLSAAHSCE